MAPRETIKPLGGNIMAEKLRIIAFDTVQIEDGDWDGPHQNEDVMTYKSNKPTASIKITRGADTVLDADFKDAGAQIRIVGNVIHLPEGLGPEV
jgi:hypothetical protein